MQLIKGDNINVMQQLIDKGITVDAVITDPPYNIAQKNNFHTMNRQGIDFGQWDKDFDLFAWLDLIPNLLNEDGSLFFFNAWKNIGQMAKYAETKGLISKDMFRWQKSNPMPRNRDRRYIVDFELGVWMIKENASWTFNRIDENYERPKYVCGLVGSNEKTKHTTQKPIQLMQHLIKIHTNKGDTVLDPFMGSGTTGVACMNLDRNFIGIQLDQDYFNIAKERIDNNIIQDKLF